MASLGPSSGATPEDISLGAVSCGPPGVEVALEVAVISGGMPPSLSLVPLVEDSLVPVTHWPSWHVWPALHKSSSSSARPSQSSSKRLQVSSEGSPGTQSSGLHELLLRRHQPVPH